MAFFNSSLCMKRPTFLMYLGKDLITEIKVISILLKTYGPVQS